MLEAWSRAPATPPSSGLDDDEEDSRMDVAILRYRGPLWVEEAVVFVEEREVGRARSASKNVWTAAFSNVAFGAGTVVRVTLDDVVELSFEPAALRGQRRGDAHKTASPNAWFALPAGGELQLRVVFQEPKAKPAPPMRLFAATVKRRLDFNSEATKAENERTTTTTTTKATTTKATTTKATSKAMTTTTTTTPTREGEKETWSSSPPPPRLKTPPVLADRLSDFVWGSSEYSEEEIAELVRSAKTPVFLHVYDVGRSTWVGTLNDVSEGIGGVFHVAVEVVDKEFSFGGCDAPGKSGVFANRPRNCPLHTYRQSVYLGDSGLSKKQVLGILKAIRDDFKGADYDVLRHNCCSFAREFALELGVGELPNWVDRLAHVGASLDDVLSTTATPPPPRSSERKTHRHQHPETSRSSSSFDDESSSDGESTLADYDLEVHPAETTTTTTRADVDDTKMKTSPRTPPTRADSAPTTSTPPSTPPSTTTRSLPPTPPSTPPRQTAPWASTPVGAQATPTQLARGRAASASTKFHPGSRVLLREGEHEPYYHASVLASRGGSLFVFKGKDKVGSRMVRIQEEVKNTHFRERICVQR